MAQARQNQKALRRRGRKKSSASANKKAQTKVCNKCGHENPAEAAQCEGCESQKFAPSWVLAKRPINRQVAVEITETSPSFGDIEKRITLSKWWPGGSSTFHIPNGAQWLAIANIIENDLAPSLGWDQHKELISSIRQKLQQANETSEDVKALVSEHPEVLKKVVGAINLDKLTDEGVENLVSIIEELTKLLSGLDSGFKEAFLSVVKELPRQRKRALEDLEELLASWSLHQVTTVSQQVRQRLDTIDLFKERIMDPRTYELRGDKSIHRILEKAMWLVDERYWLMHSNSPLRTFIGDEMIKKDKRFEKKRPDFVCGTVGARLIIIEIKRPAHTLTIDDLNQLETYLTIAEQYSTFSGFEGYLIGNKKDDDLVRRLRHRSKSFKVWTYSDLLAATEERYRGYLGQ